MEDKSMIVWGAVILGVVLFILILIPVSKPDILGQFNTNPLTNTVPTPSGAPVPTITELSAQRLKVGTGSAQVAAGDTVTVHYKGMFTDGRVFDDSYQRNQPFTVQIGAGQVIPGFEQGVAGMVQGEIRRLFIPANLAYGAQGQGQIPPNTPLVFDIELLSITSANAPTPEATSPSEAPAESPTPTPAQ